MGYTDIFLQLSVWAMQMVPMLKALVVVRNSAKERGSYQTWQLIV